MPPKPIKPVYARYDYEQGAWLWGLNPGDYERMKQGYACPVCLEPFNHWVPVCPVCKSRNELHGVPLPSEWRKQGE